MTELQVYKASAGSGKTFTLALEYIKLLIQAPDNYRSILAVTFTNKATAEMKERILSQLYGISSGLSDSRPYFDRVKKDLGLPDDIIIKNSKKALHNILHDFSYFHVETIDSFFQMIVRNLAHELNLSNNLNLDLDQQTAIDDAVDKLMENLSSESQIISWILDYIRERIDENSSWNITRQLKDFGKHVFNKHYQKHAATLQERFQKGLYKNYKKNLQATIEQEKKRLMQFGETFVQSLEDNGIDMDDFKWKKKGTGANYFLKLKEGNFSDDIFTARVKELMNDLKAWPGNTSKKDRITELAETTWIPMLKEAETYRAKSNKIIKTCLCIRKNFNDLLLLSSIHTQLQEENQKNNRLLLAQTPHLLNQLIDGSDTPFIFEKIGTHLKHIMIDDFQDTSRLQWNNFKSLLTECLSQGNNSLIVGDIKQSIYRWREGDWKILSDIKKELPNIAEIHEITLDTNRRSCGNIIDFNNHFFCDLITVMEELESQNSIEQQFGTLYKDVSQKISSQKEGKGYVHVTLINEKDEKRVENYQAETLKEISETVKFLLDNGAEMNDIAILVRKKKPIPDIAKYFAHNMEKVPIVSNEAFLLSASVAVCTIIEALSYLNTDENTLSEIQLATVYQNQILHNDISLNQICQLKAEARRALLPEEFLQQYGMLRLLPLYELIENIIRIFHLQEIEHQEAYIFFFLDQVMEFLKKESGDILSFLNFWEENLSDKQIPAGKINGIQIHSIHASKGLDFKHVIIPFCDWELTRYGDPVWTETNSEDETELPVIPVTFGKDMKESDFKDSYNDELQQQWIDNINLLYVAFTRPKANLFIIGKCPTKKNGTLDNVSALIYRVLNNQEAKSEENKDFIYSFGTPYFSQDDDDKKTSENPLLAVPIETPVKIENHITHIEFRQSNKSKQFIGDQDTPENHDFIQQGLILHSLFSQIQTVKDVEPMLRQFEFDGIIGSNLTQNRISQLVHKALQNPIAKDWFSGDWEVINECSILQNTGVEVETHRPDRVMVKGKHVIVVDFKFGNPDNKYIRQIQGYMNLLSQMGYQKVEGYLWYVYKNHIEPVTLN